MAEPAASPELNGCLVALEGPAKVVATQLRLLPTSPQILILPALQHYLGDINKDEYSDATQLIHRVHLAAQKRHAEAQEFLQQSTAEEGRIVFTHGGTVGAHALCLSAISKQQTSGNIEEADLVFCQLASKGAAHLAREASRRLQNAKNHGPSIASLGEVKVMASPRSAALVPRPLRLRNATPDEPSPRETVLVQKQRHHHHSPFEDPVIRAMRAADLLDRETAFLQPASNEVDMTVRIIEIKKRKVVRRSMSLSVVDSVAGSILGSKGSSASSEGDSNGRNNGLTSPYSSWGRKNKLTVPSSHTNRRTPLRIEIPSPLIRWTGIREEPAAEDDDQSALLDKPSFSRRHEGENERPRSADDKLTFENQLGGLGKQLVVDHDDMMGGGYHRWGVFEQWGQGHNANLTEPPDHEGTAAAASATAEEKTFEPVLPLREDLVIYLSTPQADESLDLVFQGFQRGDYTDRMPVRVDSGALEKGYDNTRRMLESLSPSSFTETSSERRKHSWIDGGLVHGLPTPGHSPTPSEVRPVSAVEPFQRFWNLPVGEEPSVLTQNSLRSILTSQCAQIKTGRRPRSSGDGSVTDSIWDQLSVVSRYVRKGKVDMILGVGGEVGVSKARLNEVVQMLEKLGCKDGVSRTGRVSLRDLIGAAMQAYTAQPLSKQTQANPFSDRAVLAALIIPYIERYLCAHPKVQFLLVEYPSEHLETILAVQKLMGSEIMKIAGIIHGDASALNRPFSPPPSIEVYKSSTAPMSQEDFGSILEALLGSPSFTQTDYILPSVASEADTASFLTSVHKRLVSVSDFYTPPKTPISEVVRPPPPVRRQVYPALIIKAARTQTTEEYQEEGEEEEEQGKGRRHHSIASSGLDTPPASPAESFCPSGLRPPVFRDSAALSSGIASPRNVTTPISRNVTPMGRNSTPTTQHLLTAQKQVERRGWGRPRGHAVYGGQQQGLRPYGFSTGTAASSQTLSRIPNQGRKNQLRQVATLSHLPVTCDEEDGELDEEARRLMPMYGRRRGSGGGGDGKKALKWLGLA
ncbi:hypothetical protein QBC41DRAFT_297659 [Cercophora samala]|uniref:Uncharacterized protein n=1 Tax=Cercophora samala TaxID=330535 RepID=A0AA40DF81_9PEZI|nr:hypothetical protein QBC41DRAFT_297659 [Cercophora samala]